MQDAWGNLVTRKSRNNQLRIGVAGQLEGLRCTWLKTCTAPLNKAVYFLKSVDRALLQVYPP